METYQNSRSLRALATCVFTIVSISSSIAYADGNHHAPQDDSLYLSGNHISINRADGHAPIGVMGDHLHKKGEWMLSYRFMRMEMGGNRIGDDKVSPSSIATTVPNRFSGIPGQPPTLRIVPTKMNTDMHMFGAMYAPSDSITLMAMVNYLDKDMDHTTFAGGAGTAIAGTFTTRSRGIGDTRFSGLIRLFDDDTHHVHLNAGLSIPTGSIKERDRILAPNGTTPIVRLPYAMQLGSGTWDALPGITYQGRINDISWGAQYMATLPLAKNSQDYRLGHKHELTAWAAYQWKPWISSSVRVAGRTQGKIKGLDSNISGPVQTADPDNYGGKWVDLMLGVNLVGQEGALKGHRLALEVGLPVYQHLNGPQMEMDISLRLGWQKAF